MNVPDSAADDTPVKNDLPPVGSAYISNPYAGKEFLTRLEAFDLLSTLAGELFLDERNRT